MCITFSEQAKNSKSEKNDIWKRGLRGDKQVILGGGAWPMRFMPHLIQKCTPIKLTVHS